MKILMVISEAPPVKSGISRVGEKLSSGLRKLGHQVDVFSLTDIPRYEFGEFRFSSMPFKLHRLKKLFSQYDAIHLHGPVPTFSDVFLLWGLRGLGKKRPRLIFTYHAPIYLHQWWLRPAVWAYNLLQKYLARLADHIVVSTPSYARQLRRFVPARKLSVIPWGVDFYQFFEPVTKPEPFTVLYLGQIRPYKGLPVLLQAAHDLPGIRLWVIGDGHAAPAYKQLAAQLDLDDVKFWGRLPDEQVLGLIKQAHVIVLPSITPSEAFGIVLLEGMSAGLVPVASHLPGVADLVGNEGFTFVPGKADDLREILIDLRDDPGLRQHLATLAQAKARLYSWHRSVYGYARIFTGQTQGKGVPEIPTRPVTEQPETVVFPHYGKFTR